MPTVDTIPRELEDLVTSNVIGHVSWSREDGSIATHLMWIDWDGQHVLTSSPLGSIKGRHARSNGHVSVSVVDPANPWRYLVIRGKVTHIVPDENLAFIDRMSGRYVGRPYMRRGFEREVFVITPTHIRASTGRG
jgi:PPOX class probable F420-dependent enzyme